MPDLQPGDKIIFNPGHPWEGHTGELIKHEPYGHKQEGWRVKLENDSICYANDSDVRRV